MVERPRVLADTGVEMLIILITSGAFPPSLGKSMNNLVLLRVVWNFCSCEVTGTRQSLENTTTGEAPGCRRRNRHPALEHQNSIRCKSLSVWLKKKLRGREKLYKPEKHKIILCMFGLYGVYIASYSPIIAALQTAVIKALRNVGELIWLSSRLAWNQE